MDGAKALAIPTNRGQEMTVDLLPGSGNIHWTAKDVNGNIWLNFSFILAESELIPVTVGNLYPQQEVLVLKRILEKALILNPDFLNNHREYEIITNLQFPNYWGLGSSSTLIANIAQWAEVDPMKLFFNSFEGSGYDVAVAVEAVPIVYHLKNRKPDWDVVKFDPPFADQLFFIYLGQKQNSSNEIANYKTRTKPTSEQIERITFITGQIIKCVDIDEFINLINEHENILSEVLKTESVKRFFPDYTGAIKSLGAWGGDFIMATGKKATKYFKEKGYETVMGWDEMVKR